MKHLLIFLILLVCSCQPTDDSTIEEPLLPTPMVTDSLHFIEGINAQGHRGARGLLPENSIPGFLKALEYPINTLELDVVISKDKKVIVSHEAWFNHEICLHPNGAPILESEEKDFNIYEMTYEEIKEFDCGSLGNPNFPSQELLQVHKPSLADVVKAVDDYCEEVGRIKPEFSIEIKGFLDGYTPLNEETVTIVLDEINQLGIKNRTYLQSFNVDILNEIFHQDATHRIAYLVSNFASLEENLAQLNFKPSIYSPIFYLVNESLIQELHQKDIQVLPWTINDSENIQSFIDLGIDGFITDYPNLIEEL